MLVRDGDGDGRGVESGGGGEDGGSLEVLMLRRSLTADFVGGAYVFPGGTLDDSDRDAGNLALCSGRTDAEASAVLGLPGGGLAFWVAAVRECFEEAGILLARGRDGATVSMVDPATAERFAQHRRALNSGRRSLGEICAQEGLTLDAGGVHYFSHWITPLGVPKRFDTRFFVAAAPPGQQALHDDRETTAQEWVRPAEALARQQAGELEMILPTIKNLEAISRFVGVGAVGEAASGGLEAASGGLLGAAAAMGRVPATLPRIADTAGRAVRIFLPGDPGYADALRGRRPEGSVLTSSPGGPIYEA